MGDPYHSDPAVARKASAVACFQENNCRRFAALKMVGAEFGIPLTRPAPADENAVAGHPLPQGGEGVYLILGDPAI
jgi:hypothetical protein